MIKTILLIVLVGILIIASFVGLAFGLGWINVGYKNTIGVATASADRNIFKENKSYVEGNASDLAKYKYDFTIEKDPIAKKAIIDLIIDKYGNFDISKLEDLSLQRFLQDVRSGKYNNLEEK